MIKTLKNPTAKGVIKAIASKSEVHRYLLCAALADKKTDILCEELNEDIIATVSCLNALGAEITYKNNYFSVLPIKQVKEEPLLPCNESGSTLRFLLPTVSSFGKNAVFEAKGRLGSRPLSPLKEELQRTGAQIISENGRITVSGKCTGTAFSIPGNVSSQFISGLMFMLTKTGGKIKITESIESLPYIEMTIKALRDFGCDVSFSDNTVNVPKTNPLLSPQNITSSGDWSNAAFFITLGIIGASPVKVTGLDIKSAQGDKAVIDVLKSLGGDIRINGNEVTAYPSVLTACDIDAKNIPDLVPVLSVAATKAEGTTRIYNCSRLRIKESDRIEAVRKMISALGGKIHIEDDDIIIKGSPLTGGTVDSCNDHRIAMSAAVAAFISEDTVTINGAEAVNKSYPTFWEEIK